MPKIVGMTLTEAETHSTRGACAWAPRPRRRRTNPRAPSLSQEPTQGEQIEKGQAVDVTVSGGPGQTVVPNVVGMTSPENASKQLELSKLKLAMSRPATSDQPQGYVLSQSPEQGTNVDVGTEVNITVSNGLVTVPDVVGSSEAQSTQCLVECRPECVGDQSGEQRDSGNGAGAESERRFAGVPWRHRDDHRGHRSSTPTPTPTPTTTSGNQQNPDRQGQSAAPSARNPEGTGQRPTPR